MEWNRKLTAMVMALVLLCSCVPAMASAGVAQLEGLDSRYLLLASAVEPLDSDYVPMGLENLISRRNTDSGDNENGGVYMASSQSMQLVDAAYAALKTMFAAAESEGVTLYVRQAYRSYADEVSRYERLSKRGEALDLPGQSDWQTGLAVSVVSKALRTKALTADGYLATAEGQWVTANCARFGFVVRYPEGKESATGHASEPWHLRYVGESVAAYMTQNGLTLEEFRAELDGEVGGYVMPEGDTSVKQRPAAQADAATAAGNDGMAEDITDAQSVAEATPAPVIELSGDLPTIDNRYVMLTNAAEPLHPSYVPVGLESIVARRNDNDGDNENGGLYKASSGTMQLVDAALSALKILTSAAEDEGITLYVRQAYRSYEDEEQRYERLSQRGENCDVPGQSDWQTGLAVTLVGKSQRTKELTVQNYLATQEGQWVVANAAAYGFVIRYPEGKEAFTGHEYEPWHLRYVGEEVAAYMAENSLCLEELRSAVDALTGGYVMPEGDAAAAAAWVEETPVPTPTPKPTPTAVPDVLPGGIEIVDYAEDGDFEYSLFND